MHRVTSVQNLLETDVLLVADGDHMVRPRKARPENVQLHVRYAVESRRL